MTLPVAQDYNIEIASIGQDHFEWLEGEDFAGWVIIVDHNTRKHCLPLLQKYLRGERTIIIEVPPGELHKHLDTCRHIWEEMFRGGAGRRWCCLNLGGGVIGDMGGFAASTFKRGMDFVQIPTTLLSQVDASVGGKLGVDFFEVKNSIGLFANPRAVWVDPAFLQTLPAREIRSGFAEIIKHALIASPEQWEAIKQITDLNGLDWETLIGKSVDVKREIVLEDPYERGRRKALNFGHTIGHAVESYFLPHDNRLLHGEAIAIGMICEAWLSTRLANLSAGELKEITDYLLQLYGHQEIPPSVFDHLLDLMKQDKKNEDERINFTLLDRAGVARVNATAEVEMIRKAMEFYNGSVRPRSRGEGG